ncbi:MAG: hypothetical protein BMS9Abin37_0360 [Acidobacteriota bacterium]|nr:MAG: hypothetical protein BMS9Abin37_0360 [Acidobacteriota bacterium]
MRKLSLPELTLVRHLVTGSEPPEQGTPVDWELVLTCAGYHRLGPLLHEGLKRSPVEAPSFVATRLQKGFHVELAKAVVRLHHVDALAAASVRSGRLLCLLKGAAFTGSLYPNPASRPMADIDVLVHPGELAAWESEVEALGFRHHDASDHATCFRHRHTGVFLELHRSLTSSNDYFGIDTASLLERSLPSGALRTLSHEDHLMHLCLHASFQHGYRQAAVNACDAHRLVARPEFDRELFLARVDTARLAPWVYGGLCLSHSVFPSNGLAALANALRDAVPHRLARKLARLDAATGLSPDPQRATRTPFRRLLWAGDASSTLSLLIEVLRPHGEADPSTASPWIGRAAQLVWNHCLKIIPLALMKHAQTFQRPTPASLGEVRDV